MAQQDTIRQRILSKLNRLYGAERVEREQIAARLFTLIEQVKIPHQGALHLSERDAVLITYGDMVATEGEPPLVTLREFLRETLYPAVNSIHILPFYPYSSDDGFSVIDYYAVNPALGNWNHVQAMGEDFNLMFDAVVNHVSAHSKWFQAFLRGEAPYDAYFITVPPETDLSQVVRPRALPLLTPFETAKGTQHVWTTFSTDQIDLNFANADVLLDVLRVLLFYVEKGAKLIRLDAVAFIWKEIGTSCIHLEPTHLIIQLMRDMLDAVAPSVVLITETNVPHEENIAYFGDGTNEAQLVYNFALPPLIYHTMITGDASILTQWAAGLHRVSNQTTFFNFTASHDGIGLRPATGILSPQQLDNLVAVTQAHGGLVSYRHLPNGSQSPYELNITYFDAINSPEFTARSPELAVRRFMVSQAIMLALMGVPGIYFHSVFGSQNNHAGVEQTKQNRTINREKLDLAELRQRLQDPNSIPAQVYTQYRRLLEIRRQEAAFHPFGDQKVLDISPAVFAVERISPDGQQRILALHNVTGQPVSVRLPGDGAWTDLLSGKTVAESLVLISYDSVWIKKVK